MAHRRWLAIVLTNLLNGRPWSTTLFEHYGICELSFNNYGQALMNSMVK
jgi:hypothetical protein